MNFAKNLESLEETRQKVQFANGNNLLYDLSHTQQMLDNYVVATNITPFKDTTEFPGLNEQINRLRANATDIKDTINSAINKVISSINTEFIIFYGNLALHGSFVDMLDHIANDTSLKNFKITIELIVQRIQNIITNISGLETPSNASRKKAEDNARISSEILKKANEKKTHYTAELNMLNRNIVEYDRTIKDKLAFIAKTDEAIKMMEFIIQEIRKNFNNVISNAKKQELANLKEEIQKSYVAIKEAQKNKEMSLNRILTIDNSLLSVNAVLDKVNNLDDYSAALAQVVDTLKLRWLSISNLLSSILEKLPNIRDENLPIFLKEVFLEEFKTLVNSLKDKFAIREEKLAADNSFKINIDPKINRHFNYFSFNSNDLISMPSNLAFTLASNATKIGEYYYENFAKL